jgi:restriction system protein
VLLGVSLVVPGNRNDEGVYIEAIAPAWRTFAREFASDSNAFRLLDPRQMEELVAGAYREEGCTVTLTPRSGDKVRDVIAHRDDFGSIRILDQVKAYKPGLLVPADDVRAMWAC